MHKPNSKYKVIRIICVLFLIMLLVLERLFETELFYDPLIPFFKQDYLLKKVPQVNVTLLLLNTVFRYALNMLISLAILYVIFKDKDVIKFSFFLFVLALVILLPWMAYLVLNASPESNYNLLFYVRRFLIQPIFILFLLPAFYYHKLTIK
ncbi:MAG: exosortase F system-associated protein [Flavobacteriaceae bacterium CG_4_8_14_3_um_filter_34_10]|nr:exosortase F system-associated protein [Flavobacteriia bacterium]OIP51088.1 MAG: exosortase F system-associated protein [Flavobacteriaceae bacterium CG2_30_34_30]PIX08615.1 MAG: exosortase F system-associated protein [Flavobacteriaceae bacterium CG_4_8_14_3_um_filter_34_10]